MQTIVLIKRPEVGSSLSASLLLALCHHVFMALQDPSGKESTVKESKLFPFRADPFSE